MRWPGTPVLPIGIDLGAHSFKAVQLDPAGGRVAATLSLPTIVARRAGDGGRTAAAVRRARPPRVLRP